MGVVSLVGVVTAVTSASIGAVVSVSELVEEFKESSVPPLHEVIVILTKKMLNMTIIFFTLSSNIFLWEKT